MKKIVFLSTLAVWSTGALAVDISDIHSLVFINESNDIFLGGLRESGYCDQGNEDIDANLVAPGLPTVPFYTGYAIDYFEIPSFNDAHYKCVTLNGNNINDDIFLIESTSNDYGIGYSPGISGVKPIVIFPHDSIYEANFCYVEDVDGIDGNDDKYVWPSYENGTLTIHMTDSSPPSDLNNCDSKSEELWKFRY
ncbi:hypothetical protein V9N52_004188 [Vibrio navarrensis]